MSRSVSVFVLLIALICLAGCGGSSVATQSSSAVLGARSLPLIKPPALLPGPLDGLPTPRILALRRPLSVIVENYDPDSRPQSGLNAASTVFETLAEGGITRFLAVYLEKDAPKVGPVRSTRVYFDNWAAGLHTILTHVGGNDDAQSLLWHLPTVFNIDENKWEINYYNTGTHLFWRASDRVVPHNMYVSTYTLRSYAVKKNQNWAYTQTYWLHKAMAPFRQRGHAQTIDLSYINPLYPLPNSGYPVRYVFDRASDTYLRIEGGSTHVDASTGHPLRPANVVVMKTDAAVADPAAGPTPQSILIRDLGRGPAIYFRDGHVSYGTWFQHDRFAPLRLLDGRGRQVQLNPGQTWIELVPAGSSVSWTGR